MTTPIIQATNQTSWEVSKMVTAGNAIALSFIEKSVGLASQLFSKGRQAVMTYPWVTLTALSAILIGSGFLLCCRKSSPAAIQQPLPSVQDLPDAIQKPSFSFEELTNENLIDAVQQLITHATESTEKENENENEVKTTVNEFVNQLFQSTLFKKQIGSSVDVQHFQEFLESKLYSIINSEQIDPQTRRKIATQVIGNFFSLVSTALSRVHTDAQGGTLFYLGVNEDDAIAEIHPLGDETHNGGKIPLKLIFESGKTIVYKPRSMEPERVICDREDGVLKYEEFGTYGVISLEDEKGEAYGYSEFVQNIEEENQVSNTGEIAEYVGKMCRLEQIARKLGLSDLHYLNIITDHLNPCIIDAEVFLNPSFMPSGIMEGDTGALFVFDLHNRGSKHLIGKNKIWIPNHLAPERNAFSYKMSKEDLLKIGVDVDKIQAESHLSEKTEEAIALALRTLQNSKGRYVLVLTQELKGSQGLLDSHNENSIKNFIDDVRYWVNADGRFTFNEDSIESIRDGIIQDIDNHDVPVFYYDSQKGTLLYHDAVIGILKEQDNRSFI